MNKLLNDIDLHTRKTRIFLNKHKLLWILFLQLCFILLSFIIALPILRYHGVPFYADNVFQWQRVNELVYDFEHFQLPQFNFISIPIGAATPTMYPFLGIIPLVFFKIIGFSPIISYVILTFGLSYIGYNIGYYTSHTIFHRKISSFLFSMFYVGSTIMSYNLLVDPDYGFIISFFLFPLVFFGWINWEKYNHWYMMLIGLILISFSHILSTIIVLIFVIVMSLLNWKVINKKNYKTLLESFMIFLGMSIIYWLPTLILLASNSIIKPAMPYNMGTYACIVPHSIFGMSIAFKTEYSIFDIFAIILAIGYRKQLSKLCRQLLYFSIIIWLLNFDWLPWHWIEKTPIAIFQYPGRFCLISHLILSFLLAVIFVKRIVPILNPFERIMWFAIIMTFTVICVASGIAAEKNISSNQNIRVVRKETSKIDFNNLYKKGTFYRLKNIMKTGALCFNNNLLANDDMNQYAVHRDYEITNNLNNLKTIQNQLQPNKNGHPIQDNKIVLYFKHNQKRALLPIGVFNHQKYDAKVDGHYSPASSLNKSLEVNNVHRGKNIITFATPIMWYRWLAIIMSIISMIIFIILIFR